ncbi:hypothetical protein ACFE04_023548 [Oxalis oulophora]
MATSPSGSRSEPSNHDTTMEKPLEDSQVSKDILLAIDFSKKQVAAEHAVYIKNRVEENRKKLSGFTNHIYELSKQRRIGSTNNTDNNIDLLTKRKNDARCMSNGVDVNNWDKNAYNSQEDGHIHGPGISFKNTARPIKLPEVKRLPPYTTWVFLDRNQRMTEDQSVLGRRRIYYDQNGGEALICSDSEEEAPDDAEEKRAFAEPEDKILSTTIKEAGMSDSALESLAQCLSRSLKEVKARCEVLINKERAMEISENGENGAEDVNPFLEKDLEAALDSFDNLFCRRCLVFDCRLHGCSQDLVFPAEKPHCWKDANEENVPCGPHCYRSVLKSRNTISSTNGDGEEKFVPSSSVTGASAARKKSGGPSARKKVKKSSQSESASSNAKNISESSDSEIGPRPDKLAGKSGTNKRNSKRFPERILPCAQKKQKKAEENEDAISSSHKDVKCLNARKSNRRECSVQDSQDSLNGEVGGGPSNLTSMDLPASSSDDIMKKEERMDENTSKQELNNKKSWKAFEKGLLEKGEEIFGRNSCLIARNLLGGLKTCWEIFQYMNGSINNLLAGDNMTSLDEFNGSTAGNDVRRRSRYLRRRGKVRRLKYTWKSAAYHSIRKRITERKDQPCRQYNPFVRRAARIDLEAVTVLKVSVEAGNAHVLLLIENVIQMFVEIVGSEHSFSIFLKTGLYWHYSCGDGSLGVPNQRGDNYECRNMKLLLKQQQKVLLGRSDVSGWGAFLKNSVGKHEYLGEYTGELISHREADKRGKIYDRENSSFLFNLNDQFVLDAYRKGDKLKFANHSPDPNCYAKLVTTTGYHQKSSEATGSLQRSLMMNRKVIMVAGDHRVGIFAKERIMSGEELFYDYRYEPDRAPAWAKKPEASGSKRDENAPSSGRAKKLA